MRNQASFGRSDQPGTRAPRRGVHPALFYGMFAILLGGNALLATAFLLSSDIARLLSGQNEQVIEAYENRIAQLRVEVDRLHSRSYAQAGDLNLQLQELSQQQDVLLEQQQLVKVLIDKADQLGLAASVPPAAEPTPTAMTTSGNPDVAATADAVAQMLQETQTAMTSLADAATSRTDGIIAELGKLGVSPDLPDDMLGGTGGPLLPAQPGMESSQLMDDANAVMSALLRYKAARESVEQVPISMPLISDYRLTSGFGNRKDPFTGAPAFHAGLDFAAATGTPVYSAAAGVVSFVGTTSGYGKTVEIEHANGLMTRYPHLSAQLVREGQIVNAGTPVGEVGSTGRSTGPHLHFEVRRGDTAMDPRMFLDAGKRLLALMG